MIDTSKYRDKTFCHTDATIELLAEVERLQEQLQIAVEILETYKDGENILVSRDCTEALAAIEAAGGE